MEGSLLWLAERTGNGDFLFCRQFLWHEVNLLPPCFKERNKTEQPVCAGTNQTVNIKLSFFGGCNICWGFFLPADFLAHQWIQHSGGNRFGIKNQLARVMCCARCVFTVSFRHRKVSHLQVRFHLFLYNRHFHLKPKSWKLKEGPVQATLWLPSPLPPGSLPCLFILILLYTSFLLPATQKKI